MKPVHIRVEGNGKRIDLIINGSCFCLQFPNNPCCNISNNFSSESSSEVDLIWGNDIRSTRHSSISLHILWTFFHGQKLLRVLNKARQKAGRDGGVGGMRKTKISNFIRCDLNVLAKTEKETTAPSFKLLTKFLTIALCHRVSSKLRAMEHFHFFFQGILSKTPGFNWDERTWYCHNNTNTTWCLLFCSMILFFTLLQKKDARWRPAVSMAISEKRIRNSKSL